MSAKAKKNSNSPRKWNVLIVEDDLNARAQLVKSLSAVAQCATVADGEKAVKAYQQAVKKKNPFDFVLLDVAMPVLGGFEVLKTIRSEEESRGNAPDKNTKVIMITTYKDSLMENYNMGWDDFISKPIEADKLLKRMHAMMRR